jgi:hypothetical protein
MNKTRLRTRITISVIVVGLRHYTSGAIATLERDFPQLECIKKVSLNQVLQELDERSARDHRHKIVVIIAHPVVGVHDPLQRSPDHDISQYFQPDKTRIETFVDVLKNRNMFPQAIVLFEAPGTLIKPTNVENLKAQGVIVTEDHLSPKAIHVMMNDVLKRLRTQTS